MLKYVALVALVSLAACSRPLSENEVQMSQTLFGDTLDTSKVRVRTGIGLLPLPSPSRFPTTHQRPRPATSRKLSAIVCPSRTGNGEFPPGFALWNQIYLKRALYRDDMFAGWPKSLPMPHALLMAHELVHVWQWQNRDRTGYTPTKSGAESFQPGDPYYWPGREAGAFLSYNFEAQAALVEDYMCMTLFVPDHPAARKSRH